MAKVCDFLEDIGVTREQLGEIIASHPPVLAYDVELRCALLRDYSCIIV